MRRSIISAGASCCPADMGIVAHVSLPPHMKSLPPNPPKGFGGLPPTPPPGNRGPPRMFGGPSPGPTGSYLAPGGALSTPHQPIPPHTGVVIFPTYRPSYPPIPPPPSPPNIGSSKVGCIPPPPMPPLGPNPGPRRGSCGPNPGG